ncbi:DUF4339 domain-containing protein [Dermatobacter hominis]|uniref:DUF4339 domain-containing protein n=1 Tax=Dermatobacter hominis TaxID=2884263 RepID=UPI001D10DDC4|nr:DUF4339 domain-containing protein [Dermatobacter hominis]UDY35429.1 GYF domain-containing protein [Dermatobacter hominis]
MSDLPPLDQPQAYVVVGPNDQRGPYTLDLLIGEVVAGRLHDATPVWWPGLAEWTTMSGHPGVAAELARRRGGYAAPAAPAAPPAPAPGQYEQTTGYESYQPQQPQPQSYEAGQYETTSYGAGEAVQSAPGQDYSYDTGVQAPVTADQSPAPEAVAPVSPQVQPVEAPADVAEIVNEVPDGSSATGTQVPAGWTVTDTSTPVGAAPVVDPQADIVEAEVVTPEVVRSSSVTDEHRSLFAGLVDRSTRRAEAGDRVQAIDRAFVDAVVSGAESQGFTSTDRTAGETNHELRFDGESGEQLSITVGRIKGDDPAAVRAGHVPLTVRFQSASYSGALESGTGGHGEVVIVSDEWSGQATSTVSLLLPLEDYVREDLEVDAVRLLRDVGATVSIVSDRLR